MTEEVGHMVTAGRHRLSRLGWWLSWSLAAASLPLAALIAGWVVASASTVGEHVPERVAIGVVEVLSDGVEASVEFGRFCGFPCFVDVIPDGPDYGGHAEILVRSTDQASVEAMPSGFRRWAAPVTAFAVLGAGAVGLGVVVARRRARLRRQVAASARSRL